MKILTALTTIALLASNTPLFAQAPAVVKPELSKRGDADFPLLKKSKRHKAKVQAVKTGEYDLVLIGDSITQCIGDSGGEWAPIKAVWEKYYAPRNAINLGYSGYRTENILGNLENGELDFKTPPKVFRLLIGTNNLDDQHYRKIHTAEEVFKGTKAIVDLIRKKFPQSKILILRILPSGGPKDKTSYKRSYNRSVKALQALRDAGEMTASLADGKNVFWLDINHVFLNLDGTINSKLMPDLIHPNAAGHEAMAQAIEPTIAKLLNVEPIQVNLSKNSAVNPVSKLEKDSYDWFKRHQDILKLNKTYKPDVVFIGDSITHGWGGLPKSTFSHAKENTLDKIFPSLKTLNIGFGWDRTQNVLWRIDHGQLANIKPKSIVLNIGTNNTGQTRNARRNTAQEIAEGICACVIRIKSKQPSAKVIVMAIFPREEQPDHWRRKLINDANKLLAIKLKDVAGVSFLDIGSKFMKSDGTLSRELMPDLCHLSDKGYKIWAEALTPLLNVSE